MSIVLENGVGNASKLKVDANNRAHTASITETEGQHAGDHGDSYNINTGDISFSAAGTLVYLLNNEDNDFIIQAIAVGVGTGSTSDMGVITIIRNPTAGDLITDATAVSMNQNRNFGSSKVLAGTVYKGKSAGTLTGGNSIAQMYQGTDGRLFALLDLTIPKGSSIGLKYEPNLSSGSVVAYAALIGHIKDPEST